MKIEIKVSKALHDFKAIIRINNTAKFTMTYILLLLLIVILLLLLLLKTTIIIIITIFFQFFLYLILFFFSFNLIKIRKNGKIRNVLVL